MIVMFKPERSPSRPGPIAAMRSAGRPIAAVEIGRRYLIYYITIIRYNLKAGLRSMIRKSVPIGHRSDGWVPVLQKFMLEKTDDDDSFQDGYGRSRKSPQGFR
jgi:hypothetical protein